MSWIVAILACVPVGIWLYLLLFRGAFWRERPEPMRVSGAPAPDVVAVVPARNEAGAVGRAVASLLRQNYQGRLTVILVDDNSEDGTADEADAAAVAAVAGGSPHAFVTIHGRALEAGWTGKLWAVHQGLAEGQRIAPDARYVLLTDADIAHGPGSLSTLVGHAESGGYNLVSWMARLRTDTLAEKALIPAYIFFFQKLYPFAWVRDPEHRLGAAAGGCMLVRTAALRAIGGIGAIRGALIDDCALGQAIKMTGPVWLGLSGEADSLRGYPRWTDVFNLVARSAFTQLRYSSLMLACSVLGMLFTYLLPPLVTLGGDSGIRLLGIVAWSMMAAAYLPTLSNYRRSPLWAPLLPLVALFYTFATAASAWRYWRGRGGQWKGRAQAEHLRGRQGGAA